MFKNINKKVNKEYWLERYETLNIYLLNIASANSRFVDFELFNNQTLVFQTQHMVSLDQIPKDALNDQLFAVLFYQMCDLNRLLEHYQVNQDFVMWDEKLVFYNQDKNLFQFILLPALNSAHKKNFVDFSLYLSNKIINNDAYTFLPLIQEGKWKRMDTLEKFGNAMEPIVGYTPVTFPTIADVSKDAFAVKPIRGDSAAPVGGQAPVQNQAPVQPVVPVPKKVVDSGEALNDLPRMYEATIFLDEEDDAMANAFDPNTQNSQSFGETEIFVDNAATGYEATVDMDSTVPQAPVDNEPLGETQLLVEEDEPAAESFASQAPVDDEPLGETQILIEDEEPAAAYAPQENVQSFGETEIFTDNAAADFDATVDMDNTASQAPVDDEPLGETQILIEDEEPATAFAPQENVQSFGETEIFTDNAAADFDATVDMDNTAPQAPVDDEPLGETQILIEDEEPAAAGYAPQAQVDDEPLGETQILIEDEEPAAAAYAPQESAQSFGETEIFVDNAATGFAPAGNYQQPYQVNAFEQPEPGATEMFTEDSVVPQQPIPQAPVQDTFAQQAPADQSGSIFPQAQFGAANMFGGSSSQPVQLADGSTFGAAAIFGAQSAPFDTQVNNNEAASPVFEQPYQANAFEQPEPGATEMFTEDPVVPQQPVPQMSVDDEPLGETQILIEDEEQAPAAYAPQESAQSFGETEIFVDNAATGYAPAGNYQQPYQANGFEQPEPGATEMFTEDPVVPQQPIPQMPVDDEPLGETQIIIEDEEPAPAAYAPQAGAQSFGETSIIVDDSAAGYAQAGAYNQAEAGATVMFDSAPGAQNAFAPAAAPQAAPAKLILAATNTAVEITANPFKVGSADYVDLVLKSIHVSREHLTIFNENNTYYAIDNKSTNGSTLNGALMQPFEKYPLYSGDSLFVADVSLVFTIE